LVLDLPILTPPTFLSKANSSGLMHRVNNVMLSGHPCRTELYIRIFRDRYSFMWNMDFALPLSPAACS
jgi:hypothetical protein